MSVEISLWNLCNNNCVMCTNPDDFKDGKLINLKSIKKYLDRDDIKRKKNVRNVFVSGGETTIQPDFFNIISFIQNKYPLARLNILTNGRRFFYKEFCEACVALGNVNFIIPIHSFDEETHDATTQIKGSFLQTVTGLKNLMRLRRAGQEVEVRIIITRLNYKKIPRIVDFIQKEFPQADRLVIIFLEYEGQAIKNFEDLKLSYDDFKPELKKLKPYLAGDKEIRLYHFPLCVAPYDLWPYLWRTLRADEVTSLSQCKNCIMKEFCLGIHKNYLKLFGKKEFKPIQKSYLIKASNNFHHPIEAVKRK